MNATFYDVKTCTSVERPVVGKKVYGDESRRRYAFKAKTEDGRNLTRFVRKKEYEEAEVPVL